MTSLKNELQSVLDSVVAYEGKPTKAESLRIRNKLSALKKNITGYKKDLLNLDKAGK